MDYLRKAGVPRDERLNEAVELVAAKQAPDGRWILEHKHPGTVHFEVDTEVGMPSKWVTLRALRVLQWFWGEHDDAA